MKFNKRLEPIKVMLVNRKTNLARPEWIRIVGLTKESVIHNPNEYLGEELPSQETVNSIVEKIFQDFLQEQN